MKQSQEYCPLKSRFHEEAIPRKQVKKSRHIQKRLGPSGVGLPKPPSRRSPAAELVRRSNSSRRRPGPWTTICIILLEITAWTRAHASASEGTSILTLGKGLNRGEICSAKFNCSSLLLNAIPVDEYRHATWKISVATISTSRTRYRWVIEIALITSHGKRDTFVHFVETRL